MFARLNYHYLHLLKGPRRLRGDWIETYNIFDGFTDLKVKKLNSKENCYRIRRMIEKLFNDHSGISEYKKRRTTHFGRVQPRLGVVEKTVCFQHLGSPLVPCRSPARLIKLTGWPPPSRQLLNNCESALSISYRVVQKSRTHKNGHKTVKNGHKRLILFFFTIILNDWMISSWKPFVDIPSCSHYFNSVFKKSANF